jgi:hypothetical protein
MEMTSMKQLVLLVLTVLMAATPAVGDEVFAGTRPGAGEQPLRLTGTLVLLDVSKIDGADAGRAACPSAFRRPCCRNR